MLSAGCRQLACVQSCGVANRQRLDQEPACREGPYADATVAGVAELVARQARAPSTVAECWMLSAGCRQLACGHDIEMAGRQGISSTILRDRIDSVAAATVTTAAKLTVHPPDDVGWMT